MEVERRHIVTSYELALRKLFSGVVEMAGFAETQIDQALALIGSDDVSSAARILRDDDRVDAMEREIEADCMRLLALRQPVADDLRHVVGALKIASNLERVGDHAASFARGLAALTDGLDAGMAEGLRDLGMLTRQRLASAVTAYVESDKDLALKVWREDIEVDALYAALYERILSAIAGERTRANTCVNLMFMAQRLERIGDHATNIAEVVYFVVTATKIAEKREKFYPREFSVD